MTAAAKAAPYRHICHHCNTAYNDHTPTPSPCPWCHQPTPTGRTLDLFQQVGKHGGYGTDTHTP